MIKAAGPIPEVTALHLWPVANLALACPEAQTNLTPEIPLSLRDALTTTIKSVNKQHEAS